MIVGPEGSVDRIRRSPPVGQKAQADLHNQQASFGGFMGTDTVQRSNRSRSRMLAVLGFATLLLLGGCFLDRTPIIWNTDVYPAFVCPGDFVQLSYDTAEGGCLGDGCPEPVSVTVVSMPDILGGGLRLRGSTGGSSAGPICDVYHLHLQHHGRTLRACARPRIARRRCHPALRRIAHHAQSAGRVVPAMRSCGSRSSSPCRSFVPRRSGWSESATIPRM